MPEKPSKVWVPMHRKGVTLLGGCLPAETWYNQWYSVIVQRFDAGFPFGDGPYCILSITHISQEARHDWRDLQQIKNDVAGPEWEGLELYPAESRLVDTRNSYYLWCVPKGVIPWGFPTAGRHVQSYSSAAVRQRPFPTPLQKELVLV